MASFRLALEQGADILELDVQVTSDGHLVVMHDFTVDRTTDGKGLVKDLSLTEVRALDAGAWKSSAFSGERVPTLDEVLEWVAGKVPVAIEIKSGPIHYSGVEELVVRAVGARRMDDYCVAISFDHHVVRRLKVSAPGLATGVLFAGAPIQPSGLASAAGANVLLPHWADLTPAMVRDAHEHGLAIATWAVDGEREMGWVASLGLDAVATNYPARLARLLGRGT